MPEHFDGEVDRSDEGDLVMTIYTDDGSFSLWFDDPQEFLSLIMELMKGVMKHFPEAIEERNRFYEVVSKLKMLVSGFGS